MLLVVAEAKGWSVEHNWVEQLLEKEWGVVRRLRENWILFEEGNHTPGKKLKKRASQESWSNESDI